MTNGIGEAWRELTPERLQYEYSPSAWSKRPWEVYARDFALESQRDSAARAIENVRDAATASGQDPDAALKAAHLASPDGVARVLAFLASADADYVRGTIFTR